MPKPSVRRYTDHTPDVDAETIMHDTPSDDFAGVLKAIAQTHMPFGKYGPANFPPRGIPLYDLPYEYLAWFARKGFPDGRLGEMLRFLHLAKRDGADAMFDPIRKAVGGRTNLRQLRRRSYVFGADKGAEDSAEHGPDRDRSR